MIKKKGIDPEYINEFSTALLDGFYLQDGETFDDALARSAEAFCFGDYDLAQRVYEAAWNGWFMFASPILSNAPKGHWDNKTGRIGMSDEHLWKFLSENTLENNQDSMFKLTTSFVGDDPRSMPISCLTGDMPINTYNGIKYMSDLEVGDLVLTHAGNWKPVEEIWTRHSTDDLYEMIIGTRSTKVKITGNHPVKTNLGWVPVAELDANKHLVAVNNVVQFKDSQYHKIDLSTVIMPEGGNSTSFSENVRPMVVDIDEDLSWALGLWFAEGSVARDNKGLGNGLKITMSIDELDIVQEWLDIMSSKFAVNGNYSVVTDGNGNSWCNGWISGCRLARFFDEEFGKNAKTKEIPEWIIDLPKDFLHRFLSGFVDGDGSIDVNFDAKITISNPYLLGGLYNIALKLGHPVSMNFTGKKSKLSTTRYVYSLTLREWQLSRNKKTVSAGIEFEDGLVYCPIRSISKLYNNETVYDIRVSDDHSFSVGGIVVHNCFAMYVPDTIDGQMDANKELAALSVAGGGVGLHNGIRATSNKAPGPIPYMKTMDGLIGYYQQSKNRRGACAYYMDVSHPDIIEHIRFRIPSGGDSSRKSDNRKQFHSAVNVTDEFIAAVLADKDFNLVCPHTGDVRETVKARDIWEEILETRALTGEPYIFKIDTANRALPKVQKDKGLSIKGSNICIEITLPSSEDRTFVCCLSSLNLEKYDEWQDTSLVADLVTYLDNVIQYFIEKAPEPLAKAVASAKAERAIGIGTMGWHYYLQSKGIPFEGGGFGSGVQQTHMIFSKIKAQAVEQTEKLAVLRGEPEDLVGSGRRNSHLFAIAPNSNNSVILGTSPSIEPVSGNTYSQSTRAGTFTVKNPYLDKLLYSIALGLDGIFEPDEWVTEQWRDIIAHDGSVQHLEYLSIEEKEVFKTAFEIDQHWLIEQADARQQYVCQSQSLNLFFPSGVSRTYYNSVHLKALTSEYVKSLYYSRMERGINADVVKEIERKVIEDWAGDDCVSCQA